MTAATRRSGWWSCYHRIEPPRRFGFQRVYTGNRGPDEVIPMADGTLVLVPKGYHPTVVVPGYTLHYPNVMAGPVREWRCTDGPDHTWVSDSWTPYGQR